VADGLRVFAGSRLAFSNIFGTVHVHASTYRVNAAQIRLFVEANFKLVPERNVADELVMVCPQPGCPDKSGNRSVNIKTGKTACFRCNVNGSFVAWVKRLGFQVEDEDTSASSSEELIRLLDPTTSSKVITPAMSMAKLPEGCHRIADNLDSAYTRSIEKMAIKKNLTLEDMIRADVHFTRLTDLWEPYAIFPVLEWGRLVLFQGRIMESYEGDERPGKKFPPTFAVKYGAKYWVYNIDRLRNEGGIALVVESILNVLSLEKKMAQEGVTGVVPVCVFKHAISSNQLAKIRACKGVSEVCIMFDADATASAKKQAVDLSNFFPTTVATIPWTAERPTLDPNDDVDLAWRQFLARKSVSATDSLLQDSSSNAKVKNFRGAGRGQDAAGKIRGKNRHSSSIDELNAMCRAGYGDR